MPRSSMTAEMKARFVLNNCKRYCTPESLRSVLHGLGLERLRTEAPDGDEGQLWPTEWKRCERFLEALSAVESPPQPSSMEQRSP